MADERRQRLVVEGAIVLALVLAWIGLRLGAAARTDILLFDETVSLQAGWDLLHHGRLVWSLEWQPLYVAWHAAWRALVGDAVTSYYGQWLGTELVVTVAVMVFARRHGLGRAGAFLVAVLWATSAANATWPRVHHVALLVILTSASVVRDARRPLLPWGLGVAALVRPEYLLALLAWALWRGAAWLRRRHAGWFRPGLATLAALATSWVLVANWGGDRMWVAFTQHYAVRHAAANPGVVANPWIEAPQIAEHVFPGADTIAGALRVAPAEVLAHVMRNVLDAPIIVFESALVSPDTWASPGLLLLLGAIALAAIHRGRVAIAPGAAPGHALILPLVAVLPSLLIMAKPGYLLVPVLLVLLGLVRVVTALVAARTAAWSHLTRDRAALGAIAAMAATSWLVVRSPAATPVRPVLATITQLQAVWAREPPDQHWRMFEAEGGYCAYLDPDRCTTLWAEHKPADVSFDAYRSRHDINAVFVTQTLSSLATLQRDPTYQAFVRDPAAAGFVAVARNPLGILYVLPRLDSHQPGRY